MRLGEGVDRSGRLDAGAVRRTRDCLGEYARHAQAFGPERRLLIATSVLRDATDGRDFLARRAARRRPAVTRARRRGRGRAAFRGGTAGLRATDGTVVLVDIGGGSTEFAVGVPGRAPDVVRSLDVGVVRLTERYVRHDPPRGDELAALSRFVRAAIEDGLPAEARAAARRCVGVAGTYTTLVAHKLGLHEYSSELVHGHVLSLADIDAAIALFADLTDAERGRLPGIQKGREDVILAGALIAREACLAFELDDVRVSEADILEGAALALAEGSITPG